MSGSNRTASAKASRMAARLLGMAGRPDIPVFRGRSAPLDLLGKPAWLGTEGQGLLDLPYDGPEATIQEMKVVAH